MDEVVFKSPYPVRNRSRTSFRRAPLTVINGEINTRKRNSNNLDSKSERQKQFPINPYLPNAEKLKIIEDINTEWKLTDENSLPSTSAIEIDYDSPLEYIEESPEALKDSFCLYSRKEEKRFSEAVWCTPYREDIHAYFKEIEIKNHPDADYMVRQYDISMSMRCILIDWFIEVAEEYNLQCETIHRAVSYVDRFLTHMAVLKGKLQLVGTAGLLLASKYEEIYPPELKDFVYITDNAYTTKQVLKMEFLILKVLNFELAAPTAYTFQQLYCSICGASETVMYLSQYICELSLLDGDPFLKFLPSIIAAGSIALANYTVGYDMWDETLIHASGYQLKDLMHVILRLYRKFSGISTAHMQTIMHKYKSAKYGGVANIKVPEQVVFPNL